MIIFDTPMILNILSRPPPPPRTHIIESSPFFLDHPSHVDNHPHHYHHHHPSHPQAAEEDQTVEQSWNESPAALQANVKTETDRDKHKHQGHQEKKKTHRSKEHNAQSGLHNKRLRFFTTHH
jgi:hypothetical protein